MNNKFLEKVVDVVSQETALVKQEASEFYPDLNVDLVCFSAPNALNFLMDKIKSPDKSPTPAQVQEQEQMKKTCLQVQNNVKGGKPNNIEIRLDKGVQRSKNVNFNLGNTLIKLYPMNSGKSLYLSIKGEDTLNVRVFIGGDDVQAILAIKDDKGDDCFVRLSEFHLLSIQENHDPTKEVGLMTSYTWPGMRIYSNPIVGPSLDPIKNLLLSEWLRTKQKEIEIASDQYSVDSVGSEING